MPKKCRLFTIVELLVVVSAIAILISLLQPSIGRILKQSEKVVCMNNLRQVSSISQLYQDDHEGAFYQIWHQNPWNLGWHAWGWILSEADYVDLATQSDILYCPAGTKDRQAWYPKFFTYGVNQIAHYRGGRADIREVVSNDDGSSSDFVYMDRLETPSDYMFMLDTKTSSTLPTGKAMITNYDARWNARVWQIHDPGLGATALFGDGHVSFNAPETFHELFGSQLNFAYGFYDTW